MNTSRISKLSRGLSSVPLPPNKLPMLPLSLESWLMEKLLGLMLMILLMFPRLAPRYDPELNSRFISVCRSAEIHEQLYTPSCVGDHIVERVKNCNGRTFPRFQNST